MFNTNTELRSFVAKFHQLRRAGFEAHLNLHARGGRYWVGLCAQLGEAEQQPHHLPHQQRPRLRRSPASARRQERRRAAGEAAAEDPASDVPAAEAKMDEDEESTEEVESPPAQQSVSESEAEAPEWFKEHFKPDNKLHGNTKVVVSDQLLAILRPGLKMQKGEKFSLPQVVKSFWNYVSRRGGYSPGSDFFDPDENLTKIFGSERVKFSRMMKLLRHHIYYGGKSIYTGYDIGGWHCQHLDISFDNLL